jgi:prevent-host-death family protein
VTDVTVRDLRNHGGDVIDRVAKGERVIVTRAGKPVAELRPLVTARISADALIERWRRLPHVDPKRFREDVDSMIDSRL